MLQGQSFVYSASAYPSLRYPPMYAQLCELLDGLQLDVLQMLPLGCVFPVSFHTSMLARTLLPLVLIAVLRIIQALARSAAVKDACGSTAFFIIFLVYPGCSMKVFSTLQCVPIDDGTRWLRADLSINCDAPTHQIMTVYAWAMVVIYPIGVPVYFAVQMWLTRRQLAELQRLEKRAEAHQSLRKTAASALQVAPMASPPPSPPGNALGGQSVTFAPAGNPHRRRSSVSGLIRRRMSQVSTSRRLSTLSPELFREKTRKGRYEDIILPETVVKLIQGYELRVYWFEIVECVRKLALVCMPVFFEMGSPSQLTFGLLTCFISFGLFMYLQPFAEESDDALAQLCQGQTFVALASSMMLSADLDKNGPGSRNLDFVLCLLTFLPPCVRYDSRDCRSEASAAQTVVAAAPARDADRPRPPVAESRPFPPRGDQSKGAGDCHRAHRTHPPTGRTDGPHATAQAWVPGLEERGSDRRCPDWASSPIQRDG